MNKFTKSKKFILTICDMVFINCSFLMALFFRFYTDIPAVYIEEYKRTFLPVTIIYVMTFYLFNLYSNLWSLASIYEFMIGVISNLAANSIILMASSFFDYKLPYSVIILSGVFITIFTLGFRMLFRITRRLPLILKKIDKRDFKRVLVVGAGTGGVSIVKEIHRHPEINYDVIGFIDDNKSKIGKSISGVKVMGDKYYVKDALYRYA